VKKTLLIGLSLLAIMLLGTSLAMAYDSPEEYVPPGTPQELQGPNFVDEDGDGQCDLMGTAGFGRGREGAGEGPNFIDENGDGVCDLAGSGLAGTGQGYGPRGLQDESCGENFIDEDGDGLCDLAGTGQGYGGRGRMGNGQSQGLGQGQGWGRIARGAGQSS
jgi:hypothetical protein